MLQAKDVICVIGLLLTLIINHARVFAEPFESVYRNDYVSEDPPSNLEEYYVTYDTDRKVKRDIIKGPSLFSKIDASTADSDLAFENDDVTGNFPKYYNKPRYSVEDSLDNLNSFAHFDRGIGLPHVHKRKSIVNGEKQERASKKSTFPEHRRYRYDDVPDEVIKALYRWQGDASGETASKSKVPLNTSSDADSSKSYRTEDDFSAEEDSNAEPVVPAHELNSASSLAKKRRKINVLVNLNIKEAPGRRSGVGNSNRLGSSFITVSSEAEMPQKRHFPYFYHQRRRHKIRRGPFRRNLAKKPLADDSSSGEGSGSGTGDVTSTVSQTSSGYVKQKLAESGADDSEGSGSGHPATNIQQTPAANITPYVRNDTIQNTTISNVNNVSRAEDYNTKKTKEEEITYTADAFADHEGSTDQSDEKTSANPEQRDNYAHKDDSTDKATAAPANSTPQGSGTEVVTNSKEVSTTEGAASNKEEQVDETNTNKEGTATASSTSQATATEGATSTKEKPIEDVSNNDGTDNMKKKTGQEDKYETLEEVREKFKKWESNIIQNPSEPSPSADENNASPKTTESDMSDGSEEGPPNPPAKQHESSPPAKVNQNTMSTEKALKSNSSEKADGNNPSVKGDQNNNNTTPKSDEANTTSTSNKVEEGSNFKPNDLSAGELITEKDIGEDEPQQLVNEKPPDDFVKELIGIPAKKQGDVKPAAKPSQESKAEKETEGAKAKPKAGEKFDMEEVNKKNKEHHDIPDSDMKEVKEDNSEKEKSDAAHKLNSSDVPGIADQVSISDEKSSSEPPSPGQEASLEEKSSPQTSTAEEKPATEGGKAQSQSSSTEQHAVKQPSTFETKTIKHMPEVELEDKETKEVKQPSTKKKSSEKKKKKAEANEESISESSELEDNHDKALENPLITKEANEFSNEQEKSFASAIEKIKAQEEKLKGKEIDNEIKETLSPAKKQNQQKKLGEGNLKQLKIYKHQILSEVGKIDDLINEYHKDGHSTKELSEAKVVLQNDLNLVKELEKNSKKKTVKKEKVKEKEKLQTMPSTAYLSASSDENKEETTHRGKSGLDSKSTEKSLEKEAEKNEKQLEKIIPSYEYYFHSGQKSSVKHAKKPSLEEIHKLLKAEIKSLKQKKNGKADSQLKNIRKLVQQHLKKLISTGDIDKSAFHSLAPEIRQLGDLLKERIKSLKKKKTARNKAKNIKASQLTTTLKSGNKKASELYDQSMDVQVSVNDLKGGKVKADKKPHRLKVEPKIGILEPSLESVKGVDATPKPTLPGPPSSVLASSDVNKEHQNTSLNAPVIAPVLSSNLQPAPVPGGNTENPPGNPPGINIRTLLNTLNEKLGAVYQNAKSVNDMARQISQQPGQHPEGQESTAIPAKEHQMAHPEAEHQAHHNTFYGTLPGMALTQKYVSQKPMLGPQVNDANVPTPGEQYPSVPDASMQNAQNAPSQEVRSDYAQQQPAQPMNPPQVIDATEPQAVSPSSASAQQAMASATNNAMPQAGQTNSVPDQAAASTQSSETPSPQPESTSQSTPESKESLPMVPAEPEFEEDTTEALASLEPINTLVETLEKDITELWSYKDLYPNAESLGLDNEKVHNTYANLGSLSGLSLRRALNRALRGEDVGLGVVGGSISKGGPFSEKGLEYVLRSYFYAIEDYWNKVIRPVTGSSMIVRDVSLGGISTDYYSFCIRNHLPDDKLTNIVLWELSANDMRRYDDSLKPKPQPLEQFTRNILSYRSKPSLVFVNFFALFDWDPDLRANCRNFEDEGEDDVAKYYKITSLSWRNMVCPLLKSEASPIFTRNNLFAEDHFHPSILGHAQMSYIIIDYIRTEFLKNLVKMRPFFIGDAVEKLQIPRSIYMPRPMFKETFLWKPLCYTYMLVDNRLPNNTMPLHEDNESDFKYTVVRGFKIRSDKIAGMETKLKDQFIRYKLQIPRHEDGGVQPFKQLGIMSFTDDRYAEMQFDSEHPVRIEAKKRFLEGTVIKTIAENIEPGEHTLTIRSGDVGFLVCALVLG